MTRLLLSAFVVSLLVACGRDGRRPPEPAEGVVLPPCEWAFVERVVDGDTIIVDLDGESQRVRYIGIDTPEAVAPDQPVEPFGPEETAANANLVDERYVCLERDVSETDRFQRLLRYAWLEDGTMVNEALLRAGMATVVTFPPDVKYHESRFIPAQETARRSGAGIWE